MTFRLIFALVLLLSFIEGNAQGQNAPPVFLSPKTEFTRTLKVGAATDRPSFTVDVPLTRIDHEFVYKDKLIVIGEAGKASAVVIMNLGARQKVDWFYCYYPQQISQNLIAYVEWYPAHSTGRPGDIVLLYDVSQPAAKNRLGAQHLPLPPPDLSVPVEVGMPVFPQRNVGSSYDNNPPEGSAPIRVAAHTFGLTASRKLVFVGYEGQEFPTLRNFLVVVDLSKGPAAASSRTLDIPRHSLKRPGKNPNFLQVTRLEAISPDAIRLYVPVLEYGVESIDVAIQ